MSSILRFVALAGALSWAAHALPQAPNKYLIASPYSHVSLSPDGGHVAMLQTSLDGFTSALILDTKEFKSSVVTASDGEGGQSEITDLRWADSQRLILISKGDNDANWLHIHQLGDPRPKRILREGRRRVIDTSPNISRFVIADWGERAGVTRCRLLDIDAANPDQQTTLYECRSNGIDAHLDAKGRLRLVKKTDEKGENEAWYRIGLDGSEQRLQTLAPWMRVFGVVGDTSRVLIGGALGGAHPAVGVFNLDEDQIGSILAEDGQIALDRWSEIAFDPSNGAALGLHVDGFAPATFWLDEEFKALQAGLETRMAGSLNRIVAWSPDRKRLLIERVFALLPTQYVFLNQETGEARALVSNGGRIAPEEVGVTRLVEIANRDGTKLSAILTLPVKRPEGAMPLVVWIRPGLWTDLDRAEWHPEAGYFSTLGYATLRLNYRGSEGLQGPHAVDTRSKDGVLALFRDLEDAVRELIAVGVADSARIAVGGVGAGAWAAAYAPIASPGLFSAVLCFNGVYDLEAYRTGGGDVEAGSHIDFAKDYSPMSLAELKALSAIAKVDANYPKAVFLSYGRWSPAPHVKQATEFARAIKGAKGKAAVYSDDWWGGQFRGAQRDEAFKRAAAVLKTAFR